MRSFRLATDVLTAPVAFARTSLSTHGRSAAVVVARPTVDPATGADVALVTVTAATPRPYALVLPAPVSTADWHTALDATVSASSWLHDVHGAADWRRAQTHRLGLEALAVIGARR